MSRPISFYTYYLIDFIWYRKTTTTPFYRSFLFVSVFFSLFIQTKNEKNTNHMFYFFAFCCERVEKNLILFRQSKWAFFVLQRSGSLDQISTFKPKQNKNEKKNTNKTGSRSKPTINDDRWAKTIHMINKPAHTLRLNREIFVVYFFFRWAFLFVDTLQMFRCCFWVLFF